MPFTGSPSIVIAVSSVAAPSLQLHKASVATTELAHDVSHSNENIEPSKELFISFGESDAVMSDGRVGNPNTVTPTRSTGSLSSDEARDDQDTHSLELQHARHGMSTTRATPASPDAYPSLPTLTNDGANVSDDNWKLLAIPASFKKRKRLLSVSKGGSPRNEHRANIVPTNKRQKVISAKEDDRGELPFEPISMRKGAHSGLNKHVEAMRKVKHIPIPVPILRKQALTFSGRQGLKRVEHVAPSILANIGKNRDFDGRMNMFEHRKKNATLEPHLISEPKAQSWPDEHDGHITWLIVPTSKKCIKMYNKTIAVSKILENKHSYPQFTLIKTVEGPHKKTGKMVAKVHKFKCENMAQAQIAERIKVDLARERNAVKQAKKAAAAALRHTRGGQISGKSRA